MKLKNNDLVLLFDFFSELLTEKQREYFHFYYNEDLSLAEIAENEGITRQGVRDIIARAGKMLLNFEAKTGVVERFLALRGDAERLEALSKELLGIKQAERLSEDVAEIAARLREW